jgi:hypothetical protein
MEAILLPLYSDRTESALLDVAERVSPIPARGTCLCKEHAGCHDYCVNAALPGDICAPRWAVREFIYLSTPKLKCFPSKGKFEWFRKIQEVRIPGGGVKLEPHAPPIQDDQFKMIARIDKGWTRKKHAPYAFHDPRIRCGQWVSFLIPMSYTVMQTGGERCLVFMSSKSPVLGGGGGGSSRRPRLLLHGSSRNLVRSAGAADPEGYLTDYSQLNLFAAKVREMLADRAWNGDKFARLGWILRAISSKPYDDDGKPSDAWNRAFTQFIDHLDERSDRMIGIDILASGYARVTSTALHPRDGYRIVVGTPLFVEANQYSRD